MTHKPESPGCLLQKLHLQYRPIVVYKKLNAHAWNFLSHSYQVYRRKYLIFFFYLWTLFIKYEDQSIYAYKNISFLPSHFVYLVSCLPQPYTQNFGLFCSTYTKQCIQQYFPLFQLKKNYLSYISMQVPIFYIKFGDFSYI